MSFGPATKDRAISRKYTGLELIGGFDCNPNYPHKCVDLLVHGGSSIRKSLCVGDSIHIMGDGEICGDLVVK